MNEINEKYFDMLDMFAEWVCQFEDKNHLPYSEDKRVTIYEKYEKIKNKRFAKGREIIKTLFTSPNIRRPSQ